jgi:hypothetical protein
VANTYQPFQIYTNEALRILKNSLVFLRNCNRDNEHLFAKKGMKAGSTVNVRLPARFTSRTGETYSAQPYVETSVPVVVSPLQGVDIDLPSTEWTLNIDDVKNRVLKPAMAQLVNDIERLCLQKAYQATASYVGTPGTIPNTLKTYNQARALMVNHGCPDDGDKTLLISPDMNVEIASAVSAVFNPSAVIGQTFKAGKLGEGVGFEWNETANVWTHTIGTYGGTPLVNGAGQGAAGTLVTNGWTATTTTLNVGDIFQIAGVYNVNPMTRLSTGKLKNLVVTAISTTDGAGNSTISFQTSDGRPMAASGAFQNVSALPANGAAITVFGASGTQTAQGLGFHRDAFTFACIDQMQPGGTDQAYFATDKDTGLQLRFVRQYEARTNNYINRFDVLFAFAAQYPQLACRIAS